MIRPRRIDDAVEKLDAPSHDDALLDRDLSHIEGVNRWLGGRRAAVNAVLAMLPPGGECTLLDVGCGSGDVPRALADAAARRGARLRITALDRNPQILAIAQARSTAYPSIEFALGDALNLPFADKARDVVIMSLAYHHFSAPERKVLLRELARVAKRAVVLNELERCWPNYAGARLLAATVWRNDAMAQHDGPLSVLKAFTADELRTEMLAAGLSDVTVRRRFFHRLVACGAPRANAAAAVTVA